MPKKQKTQMPSNKNKPAKHKPFGKFENKTARSYIKKIKATRDHLQKMRSKLTESDMASVNII